jgi:uncharacterized protein (TIGR02646 family)
MIEVDLSQLQLPEELLKRLDTATKDLIAIQDIQEKKDFIDRNAPLWGEVRPYLIRLSGLNVNDAKCWYCESKGAGFTHHVDHFRPKKSVSDKYQPNNSGYWWLAFNILNYRLSCQRCNTGIAKGEKFPLAEGSFRATSYNDNLDDEVPLLLDPARTGDNTFFNFSEDGRVYPCKPENSIPSIKAKISIDVYDLNHVSKLEARKQVWLHCTWLANHAIRAREHLLSAPLEAIQIATERYYELCKEIKRCVHPSAEFSRMARFCFQGLGIDWINLLIP